MTGPDECKWIEVTTNCFICSYNFLKVTTADAQQTHCSEIREIDNLCSKDQFQSQNT